MKQVGPQGFSEASRMEGPLVFPGGAVSVPGSFEEGERVNCPLPPRRKPHTPGRKLGMGGEPIPPLTNPPATGPKRIDYPILFFFLMRMGPVFF